MKKSFKIFFILFLFLIILITFYFIFIFKNENRSFFSDLNKNTNISNEIELEKNNQNNLQFSRKENVSKDEGNFFTLNDVVLNNSDKSCYTIIRGEVFDLTFWIAKHPGGRQAILSMCGKDATDMFLKRHGGEKIPEDVLKQYKIGILKNE